MWCTFQILAGTVRAAALGPFRQRTVQGQTEIWTIDSLRTTRFTFTAGRIAGGRSQFPLWSRDGSRIGYLKNERDEQIREYISRSSGGGAEEQLTSALPPGPRFGVMQRTSE